MLEVLIGSGTSERLYRGAKRERLCKPLKEDNGKSRLGGRKLNVWFDEG